MREKYLNQTVEVYNTLLNKMIVKGKVIDTAGSNMLFILPEGNVEDEEISITFNDMLDIRIVS